MVSKPTRLNLIAEGEKSPFRTKEDFMSDDRQWIYRASWDHTLVVKPTTRKLVSDKFGNSHTYSEKPIKLVFLDKKLVINEALAKRHDLPLETLVDWVEKCSSFGGRFFLVSSPDKPATKDEMKKVDDKLKSKAKVLHGPRSS